MPTMNFTIAGSVDTTDPVTPELLSVLNLVFNCVMINVLSVVGLAGTAVNILILSRHNITSDSSNILLISLSLADFMFCLAMLISHTDNLLSATMSQEAYIQVDRLGFSYCQVIGRIVYCCSITLVGVISAERFLVVYFPFQASSLLTPFRMKSLAAAVYFVNTALFSPLLYSFKREWIFQEDRQQLVPILMPTEFYAQNYDVINFEVGVIYNNVVLGSAMLATLTLTPATAIKLRMQASKRAEMTKGRFTLQPQVAKILITVCTVSLVIYGPFICFDTAINFLDGFSLQSNSFMLFVMLTDFSGTLSASINFFIYVSMSKKFRKSYIMLFSSCKETKRILQKLK